MAKEKDIAPGLKSAFKVLNGMNEDASILDDNALSVVKDYIDTGSLALNAIVSGSLRGGFPKGRITGLVGPEQCGKTHILCKAIANEQKKDPQVWGVIWDSESAYDIDTIKNVGGDPNRIKICPVESVEDCRNQISTFLDEIIKDPTLNGKIVIGIDSLGNLASAKEIEDARKGKSAVDMGARAKSIKSLIRTITYRVAKANATTIFTNHIIDNPAELYPSAIKKTAGGRGSLYIASLLVQLYAVNIKDDENHINGVTLNAMTTKNRFIPPFKKTSLELNFTTGLYKYSGLLELGLEYGIITKDANTYMLPDGTKLGTEKKFRDDAELWERLIPILDEKLQKQLKFSSEENETLAKEVEELAEKD
jgi:RecA/RadA recombinase